jgi:hypothetical protein
LLAIGQNALFSKTGWPLLRKLVEARSGIGVIEMESYLIQAMEATASQPASGIGNEYMSVIMPGPVGVPTQVRFFRNPEGQAIAGFTPAVITDAGLIQYPVFFRGSLLPSIRSTRPVEFEVFPPAPASQPHLLLEVGSYPTRRWPK